MMKFWFCSLLALFSLAVCPQSATAQDALPPFSFQGLDGKALTFNDMPKDKPLFVLYFSPDCDHCNAQAEQIRKELHRFDDAAFLWVNAFHELPEIRAFAQKYFPNRSGQFFFAKDTEYMFDSYFGDSQVPSIYVYNRKGTRTASFVVDEKGHFDEVSAATLAAFIQ